MSKTSHIKTLELYLDKYPFYNQIVVGWAKSLLGNSYNEAKDFKTWYNSKSTSTEVLELIKTKNEVIEKNRKIYNKKYSPKNEKLGLTNNILVPTKAITVHKGIHVTSSGKQVWY